MAQENLQVSAAIENNRELLTRLMTHGVSTAYSGIGPLALPNSIYFMGVDYGYVTVGSSSTAELPDENDATGTLYDFNPATGFMLLRDPGEKDGLVTEVVYGGFALDARYFNRVVPEGLGPLLLPVEFNVSYGTIFDPHTVLGGGELGTSVEAGSLARIAAATIELASQSIQAHR